MNGSKGNDEQQLVATVDADFGARVRAARERLDLSQQYIADGMWAYGITWHQTTVGKVESGERPAKLSEAVALAVMLGYGRRLDQLIYDDPASERALAGLAGAESELFHLQRHMDERRAKLDEAYRQVQASKGERAAD